MNREQHYVARAIIINGLPLLIVSEFEENSLCSYYSCLEKTGVAICRRGVFLPQTSQQLAKLRVPPHLRMSSRKLIPDLQTDEDSDNNRTRRGDDDSYGRFRGGLVHCVLYHYCLFDKKLLLLLLLRAGKFLNFRRRRGRIHDCRHLCLEAEN